MKINEIIREKRKEIGITQEQMAQYLGVSAPAVNKWEKGISYPDITLLPAVARLLKTDLNTLMSFKEELSKQEIAMFMNELAEDIKQNGFESGFEMAMKKINEYPSCEKLISSTAMILEGSMIMIGVQDKEKYEKKIEKLYERIIDSDDVEIRDSAKTMLISKYTQRSEFEKAQSLIDSLSPMNQNKNVYQAGLYFEQGKVSEARRLIQISVKNMVMNLYINMEKLLSYSLKDDDEKGAEYYKNIIRKTVELYDMGEHMAYMADAEVSAHSKDSQKTIESLQKVIQTIPKVRETYDSMLYSNIFKDFCIDDKKERKMNSMFEQLRKSIINAVKNDEKFDFLKNNKEFQELVKKYN